MRGTLIDGYISFCWCIVCKQQQDVMAGRAGNYAAVKARAYLRDEQH